MDDRTYSERVADKIARFGGSWRFIFAAIFVLTVWVSLNTLHITNFDPFPFILLNLLLSLVAAFQAPFILMSQNRAEKKQDQAYRFLFRELKELLEQDLDHEKEIHALSQEIMAGQQAVRDQHARLLSLLQERLAEDSGNIIHRYRDC